MPDYGHDLLFGTFLIPLADRAQSVVELAELTERVGLDLVSTRDHPYQLSSVPDEPSEPAMLDTMTLLAAIASRTERVRLVPNVANLPLRQPPMLARAAASIDILSNGRFDLGLGTGVFWDAIAAEGGPRRTPGESVAALEEAIHVIRSLWTPGDPVTFDGKHYRLDGVKPGPFPARDIPIWLGAYQPRMLGLVGRLADGWLPSSPYLPPEYLPVANQTIDDAALKAGRSPQAIRRLYNITGSFEGTGAGFLQGPPKVWVEQLVDLTLTQGMSGYILYQVDSADFIRRFAAEVAPAVRELVAAERDGAAA
jgi:alkanesulfonate monooxygenase SsuD/methylene tetrahydromethanopterin reductase-like flavin-dependent oxidoreductase (luciferase family)